MQTRDAFQNSSEIQSQQMPLFIPEDMLAAIHAIKKQNPALTKISKYDAERYGLKNLPCSILFDHKNNKTYAIGKKIGEGANSVVKYIQDLDTKNVYAVKRPREEDLCMSFADERNLPRDAKKEQNKKDMQNERNLLSDFKRYVELISVNNNKLYGIQELEQGEPIFESLHFAAQKKQFTPSLLLEWIRRAISYCEALNEVHKKGFLHRDVNEDNLLYQPLRFIDLSSWRKLDNPEVDGVAEDKVIYSKYKAPETIFTTGKIRRDKYYYSRLTDIFSLGETFQISLQLITKQYEMNIQDNSCKKWISIKEIQEV